MYLPSFGFALDFKVFHRKKAMEIPVIITNSVTSIGNITTTGTTVMSPVLPSSDIVLALALGTPVACDDVYLCSTEVDSDSGDNDFFNVDSNSIDNDLCLINVDSDNSDNDSLCLIEVDSDSGEDDSVDQQKT